MKLGNFVISASALLLTWLAFTFIREVPSKRYMRLEKPVAKQTEEISTGNAQVTTGNEEPAFFHVSVSQ